MDRQKFCNYMKSSESEILQKDFRCMFNNKADVKFQCHEHHQGNVKKTEMGKCEGSYPTLSQNDATVVDCKKAPCDPLVYTNSAFESMGLS